MTKSRLSFSLVRLWYRAYRAKDEHAMWLFNLESLHTGDESRE